MKTVDARGLSCPEPVIITKKALASKDSSYEILVDNITAKENVTRLLPIRDIRLQLPSRAKIIC